MCAEKKYEMDQPGGFIQGDNNCGTKLSIENMISIVIRYKIRDNKTRLHKSL